MKLLNLLGFLTSPRQDNKVQRILSSGSVYPNKLTQTEQGSYVATFFPDNPAFDSVPKAIQEIFKSSGATARIESVVEQLGQEVHVRFSVPE